MAGAKTWIVGVAIAFSGCTPGTIAWHDGDDVLRTAYFEVDRDPLSGWDHARVLLSNGQFPCAIGTVGDAAAQVELYAELAAAACREDARHVALDLYWPPEDEAAGHFVGDARANPGDVGAPLRFASALYVGVNEAGAPSTDDFVHPYTIIDRDYFPELGVGGVVEVTRADDTHLNGSFSFPEAHVSGAFRAATCPPPPPEYLSLFALFDQRGGDPTVQCGF